LLGGESMALLVAFEMSLQDCGNPPFWTAHNVLNTFFYSVIFFLERIVSMIFITDIFGLFLLDWYHIVRCDVEQLYFPDCDRPCALLLGEVFVNFTALFLRFIMSTI
jgi:hypothetical protein